MEYLNKNNLNKVRKNLNESPKYDNFFRMEKPWMENSYQFRFVSGIHLLIVIFTLWIEEPIEKKKKKNL